MTALGLGLFVALVAYLTLTHADVEGAHAVPILDGPPVIDPDPVLD